MKAAGVVLLGALAGASALADRCVPDHGGGHRVEDGADASNGPSRGPRTGVPVESPVGSNVGSDVGTSAGSAIEAAPEAPASAATGGSEGTGTGATGDAVRTGMTHTFEQIFAAEAGRWRGLCVAHDGAGMETFAADFTITWDAGHGHRFEGRYGAQSIRGHSRIAGSERIDVLDGAAEARHASIESATYRAADDYRYVLREDGRMPRRSTITRLGDLQVNMVDAVGAASRPLRICSYRLEPRAADQPTAPPSAIPADSSAARLAASRS